MVPRGKQSCNALKKAGLTYTHVPETNKASEHTIMIASRFGFDAGSFLPEPTDPLHLLEAYFSGTGIRI